MKCVYSALMHAKHCYIYILKHKCCSALQVDLVGSEKLNNSMGFSMFFVGLGCLTGPPLAGEWITSCKTFTSQTYVNLLFQMHAITGILYALHMHGIVAVTPLIESDLFYKGQGEVCTHVSVCWGVLGGFSCEHLFFGEMLWHMFSWGPEFLYSASMCVFACLCACAHYGL